MTAPRTYHKPADIARDRGVQLDSIYSWIAAGELVAVDCSARPGGRPRWRISGESLAAFDLRRSSKPTPRMTSIRRRNQGDVTQYF